MLLISECIRSLHDKMAVSFVDLKSTINQQSELSTKVQGIQDVLGHFGLDHSTPRVNIPGLLSSLTNPDKPATVESATGVSCDLIDASLQTVSFSSSVSYANTPAQVNSTLGSSKMRPTWGNRERYQSLGGMYRDNSDNQQRNRMFAQNETPSHRYNPTNHSSPKSRNESLNQSKPRLNPHPHRNPHSQQATPLHLKSSVPIYEEVAHHINSIQYGSPNFNVGSFLLNNKSNDT